MAQITITVCDTCGNRNRETEQYTVQKGDGEKITKTLCATHGAPLDVFIGARKASGRKPGSANGTAKKAASSSTGAAK